MKSTQRTKEEIARNLELLANKISDLKEYPTIPHNAGLEEKLNSHTTRWRSLYNEVVAETFLFAKKLNYDKNLLSLVDYDEEKNKAEKVERFVMHVTEPLMKVVYRCLVNGIKSADNCRQENFILYFEKILKDEFRSYLKKEKVKNRRQGIPFSDNEQRIVNHYLRFKESIEKVARDRKKLSDQKIQELYLCTHNHYNITPEKLAAVLEKNRNTFVALMKKREEDDDNETLFDTIPDTITVHEDFDTKEFWRVFFDAVLCNLEELWQKKQNRAKTYFSALLSHWILEQTKDCNFAEDAYFKKLESYSFIDKNLLWEFRKTGAIPERKVLLQRFPVLKSGQSVFDKDGKQKFKDEGRASNDLKGVLEELKEKLKVIHQDGMMQKCQVGGILT